MFLRPCARPTLHQLKIQLCLALIWPLSDLTDNLKAEMLIYFVNFEAFSWLCTDFFFISFGFVINAFLVLKLQEERLLFFDFYMPATLIQLQWNSFYISMYLKVFSQSWNIFEENKDLWKRNRLHALFWIHVEKQWFKNILVLSKLISQYFRYFLEAFSQVIRFEWKILFSLVMIYAVSLRFWIGYLLSLLQFAK